MAAALFVVQLWRVASAGYGWLVGLLAAGLAVLAWAAGGQEQWLLLVMAGISVLAVGLSMAKVTRVASPTGSPAGSPTGSTVGPLAGSVLEATAALVGLTAAAAIGADSLDPAWLGALRALTGAAFVGAVTDAMILGHWYLIDPKLPKFAIRRLNAIAGGALALEVIAVLVPPASIVEAFGGTNGTLAVAWVVSVVLAAVLIFLVSRALNEPGYAAVMSATGLLYVTTMVAFAAVVLARVAVESTS